MITLPDGYNLKERIELMKDEALVLRIVVLSVVVAVAAVVAGVIIAPFHVRLTVGPMPVLLSFLIFLLAYGLLIVVHELIHGVFMKKYSGVKVKYGFKWTYAYAGSDAYFNKRQYIAIGLAPVVIIGIFLLLLSVLLPGWFWNIHIMQVLNLSSAGGDFYMAYYIRKQPGDVLVLDDGPAMSIFTKHSNCT